jgi:hypothetical protein
MMSWVNTCAPIALKTLTLQKAADVYERFPIRFETPMQSIASLAVPVQTHVQQEESDEEYLPLPPVPCCPTIVKVAEKAAEKVPEHSKKPHVSKQVIDPVVLGIEITEPLYNGAPYASRHRMEMEAAQKLETQLDTLYKTCSGRSRGWTKVGLEGMIKPRCASGGDLKELDRAKKPFLWVAATEDKAMSAFLDFVCCARRIRCVVFDEEKRTAHLYPAADQVDEDTGIADATTPIYFVKNTGHLMYGLHNSSDLLTFVDKEKWILQPPASLTHSLSGLKLDELESVGKRLGMDKVEGNKAERVKAIAAFKTRARLL